MGKGLKGRNKIFRQSPSEGYHVDLSTTLFLLFMLCCCNSSMRCCITFSSFPNTAVDDDDDADDTSLSVMNFCMTGSLCMDKDSISSHQSRPQHEIHTFISLVTSYLFSVSIDCIVLPNRFLVPFFSPFFLSQTNLPANFLY